MTNKNIETMLEAAVGLRSCCATDQECINRAIALFASNFMSFSRQEVFNISVNMLTALIEQRLKSIPPVETQHAE